MVFHFVRGTSTTTKGISIASDTLLFVIATTNGSLKTKASVLGFNYRLPSLSGAQYNYICNSCFLLYKPSSVKAHKALQTYYVSSLN